MSDTESTWQSTARGLRGGAEMARANAAAARRDGDETATIEAERRAALWEAWAERELIAESMFKERHDAATILPLETATRLHVRLRDWLKKNYDFESDEDQCLIDSLDGISDFKEIVAKLAREARYEEAMAEACKGLIKDMQDRKARREAKAERLRAAIAWAMAEAAEKKVDAPDATISVRDGTPKLVFDREATTEDAGQGLATAKVTCSWNKEAVSEAIANLNNEAASIAHYEPATPVLTIRTR